MQHVDQGALFPRDAQEAFGRTQRHGLVAPDGMRGGIVGRLQILALVEAKLILAVESRAPSGLAKDGGDSGIVRDEERTGRRPHEHLDSSGARQAFELWNIAPIVHCAADPEGEIAMHAAFRPLYFIGERRGACGRGIGVGHFENRGHSAERSRAGAGLQVFLMGGARLAEMHLGVDHARQNMEAGGVDCLSGAGVEEIADFSDFPGGDRDVAHARAGMIGDGAALQDHVETSRHWPHPLQSKSNLRLVIGGLSTNRKSESRGFEWTSLYVYWAIAASWKWGAPTRRVFSKGSSQIACSIFPRGKGAMPGF